MVHLLWPVYRTVLFIDKEIQLKYQGVAFTVTASILSSLFVALTLVPMLSSRFPSKTVGAVPRIPKASFPLLEKLSFERLKKK